LLSIQREIHWFWFFIYSYLKCDIDIAVWWILELIEMRLYLNCLSWDELHPLIVV
jgi:hypothetical protein